MRWRYALHAMHLEGRLALRAGAPERALARAQAEAEGARRHRAPKIEARALVLAGEAQLAMDVRDAAEASLADALRLADRIAYPRGVRSALGLLATLGRRTGRPADVARHETRRRALLDGALASLPDDDLRRALAATEG